MEDFRHFQSEKDMACPGGGNTCLLLSGFLCVHPCLGVGIPIVPWNSIEAVLISDKISN